MNNALQVLFDAVIVSTKMSTAVTSDSLSTSVTLKTKVFP